MNTLTNSLKSPIVIAAIILSIGLILYGWITSKPRYEFVKCHNGSYETIMTFDNRNGKTYGIYYGTNNIIDRVDGVIRHKPIKKKDQIQEIVLSP